jgi:hypothetical protein
LPDGLSEIFLREGLDRLLGDLPVGHFFGERDTDIGLLRYRPIAHSVPDLTFSATI